MAALLHDEPVMGTVVSFRVRSETVGHEAAEQAVASACRLLHEVDATFSTWKPDSPMSRIRRGENVAATSDMDDVLGLCKVAKEMSAGWFDPWAMPGGVDPTGLVKGWAADRALTVLRDAGIDTAIVNAGGDIASISTEADPWRIGIRHPWRPDALACVVEVRSAVATSGFYERGAHLLVPKGLSQRWERSPRAVSASVCGPSLAFADALATALCLGASNVLPLIEGVDGYEGYVIFADGSEASTPGFPFAPPDGAGAAGDHTAQARAGSSLAMPERRRCQVF
jgi:thiamine biosynthesis lipoprotein